MSGPVSSVLPLWAWIDKVGAVTVLLLSLAVLVICFGALWGLLTSRSGDQ